MSGTNDPLQSYLNSGRLDFGQFGQIQQETVQIPNQSLQNSIKHIISSLASHGFPPIGNLFSNQHQQISKTVNALYAMLQQRHRDVAFRSEMFDKYSRLETQRSKCQQLLDRAIKQKQTTKSQLSKSQTQAKAQAMKSKQQTDKLLTERDDLKRENNRLTHKQAQYSHQLKKRDSAYAKLQEQLKKSLGEKDLPIRNNLEMTAPLNTSGPVLFGKSGDTEFSYMISRGYQQNQNALLLENKELRSGFELLQNELADMLQQRKEAFKKRYADQIEGEFPEFNEFQLKKVRPEVLGMPYASIGQDVVKTYQENMRIFREFMNKTDEMALELDGEDDFSNIKCIRELKELLSNLYTENYRVILKNQENLMQNAILGSRKAATDHVSQYASRLKITTDAEIEKANKFLQDEFSKLESKQQEIENHRLQVSDTQRKLEEERVAISVRYKQNHRTQLQEERARWELALETASKLNQEIINESNQDFN